MGLAAVVLTKDPSFPGFPAHLSATQVGAGLPAPTAASALLGKGGAAIMQVKRETRRRVTLTLDDPSRLVLLLFAVTSAASAELVAVSSLFACECHSVDP